MFMKITLLTYGSRGDVQPFLALAVGLQKAGHTPTLAAPLRFAGFVEQRGIHFAPLPGARRLRVGRSARRMGWAGQWN